MRIGLRELIFFAVLLAVPVASFFYVFKPRNDQINQAKAEIAKGNKAYTAEELQTLEKKLKEANDFLDAMGKN